MEVRRRGTDGRTDGGSRRRWGGGGVGDRVVESKVGMDCERRVDGQGKRTSPVRRARQSDLSLPPLPKLLSNAIRIDVEAAGAKSKSRDDPPPLTISTLRRTPDSILDRNFLRTLINTPRSYRQFDDGTPIHIAYNRDIFDEHFFLVRTFENFYLIQRVKY